MTYEELQKEIVDFIEWYNKHYVNEFIIFLLYLAVSPLLLIL